MQVYKINPQSGFTLMELVVVMVTLGILSVTVIPKVLDMSGPARLSTLKGIAAQVTAASETNYTVRASGATTGYVPNITSCSTAIVTSLLQTATPLPGTYTVNGGGTGTLGVVFTCGMYDSDIASGTGSVSSPWPFVLVGVGT